ncbi:MAG: BACON domain-containing protein [Bacteroidetes bacterium]|nr:BACON domain-containing protein [Bacteroidota bacterium]
MKTKTLKLTAFLLIIAGAFTACNGKEYPFLNIDTTTIYASAEGGIFQIAVSSNGGWTVVVQGAENNLWLTLAKASGINDGVITVNITENAYFTARSATVKISMGSLNEYVLVSQKATECDFDTACPTKLIIGKWEFVRVIGTLHIESEEHTPNGYIEFLSNRRWGWFDYATNEFTLFETRYWLHHIYGDSWDFEFETYERELVNWKGEVIIYRDCPRFPDRRFSCVQRIRFLDCSTFTITIHGTTGNATFVYARKK